MILIGRKREFWAAMVLTLLLCFSCSKKQKQSEPLPAHKPSSAVSESSQVLIADSSLADKIFARAEQFFKASRYDSAIVYFEKAAGFYEAAQNWEGWLRAQAQMSRALMRTGSLDRAHQRLSQALETGIRRLGEYHTALVPVYEVLGAFFHTRDDNDKAIYYFQKKLSILQATADESNQGKIADTHLMIGMMYAGRGYYQQALESLQRALAVSKAIDPELKSQEAGFLFFYFGSLHFHRGEYDLALEYYSKTMAIWQAFSDDAPKRLPVTNLYRNLGLIYHQKREYDRALELGRKSLATCLEQFGERHLAVAERYNNLGLTYLELGDYAKALEFHRKALDIRLSLLGERSRAVAHCYGNLGQVYARKGDYGKARSYYQKSLSILSAVLGRHHPDLADIHNLFGDLQVEMGQYSAALASYQRALQANALDFSNAAITANPSLQQILSDEKLLVSLHKKTKALTKRAAISSHARDDLQTALSTGQLAVQLVDQIRRGYKAEAAKLFLAEKSAEIYEQAILIAHALYRASGNPQYQELAWQFAEKSRAGILLDALSEVEAKTFAGIPDSLLEKEQRLRADLAFQEKRVLEEEAKRSAADSAKILKWQAELFDSKREYETLLAQFENDHPDYFNLKYQDKIATAKKIQEQFLDARTVLIEYFVGRDSIFIFALSRDQLELRPVPKDSVFERRVAGLRTAIVEQNYGQYVQVAHELYQTLLAPIQPRLGSQNLIFVPDGVLSQIPFEALLTEAASVNSVKDYGALPFLLKTHAISYAYSATLLLEMQKRNRNVIPTLLNDYLACAPLFSEGIASNSRGAEFLKKHQEVDSTRAIAAGYLPASKEEVLGVERLFKEKASFWERWFGKKVQVLLERQASEASLKSNRLDSYRYVHFATHGLVNDSRPKLSGLMLAQLDSPKEDNILYLGEIYNLNLNADLVVLSACETGLGRLARGEGLIGLARGFLYAGAANLLVSLWQVNDASTANLMVDFYQKMLEGRSKTEALREAKLRLMERQTKYARPYYWAPFVLMGK